MRKPVRPAGRAGRGQHAVADGAGRADHLDGPEYALVVGDVGGQHRANAGVGGGLGVGQRVVDGALDLRAGAGPVDDHVTARLAQGHEQPDRFAVVDAVVVDPVLEAPFAVGQLFERRARQPLGIVDRLLQQAFGLLGPIARHQLGELALGNMAGRKLGAQVAEELHGQAHVLLDERHDGLVEAAGVVELHGCDAQPFSIDLRGIGGVGAGHPPADIAVVTDGAGECEPLALVEQRLHDEDVGQVHAAVEGIVHDEDVARRDVVAERAHDGGHGRRHRAQMPRQRQALRGELAVGVGKARRVVHVVLQHPRVGGPEHRERHLVRNREDGVLEELEDDGVRSAGHAPHPTVVRRQKQAGARTSFCRR